MSDGGSNDFFASLLQSDRQPSGLRPRLPTHFEPAPAEAPDPEAAVEAFATDALRLTPRPETRLPRAHSTPASDRAVEAIEAPPLRDGEEDRVVLPVVETVREVHHHDHAGQSLAEPDPLRPPPAPALVSPAPPSVRSTPGPFDADVPERDAPVRTVAPREIVVETRLERTLETPRTNVADPVPRTIRPDPPPVGETPPVTPEPRRRDPPPTALRPAAPPPPRGRTPEAPAASESTIQISIGRIEIRAASPPAPVRLPEKPKGILTLEDYLERRRSR